MVKNIRKVRKGTKLRYIGENELMKDRIYTVKERCHERVSIYAPMRYLNGEIHNSLASFDIKDFETV